MSEIVASKTPVRGNVSGGRPEHALLLYCSRTSVDSESTDRIRGLVREDIDWGYLSRTASTHGVMPLLYQSLEAVCPDAVPKAVLDELRIDFYVNSRQNQLMTRELLKILEVFEAHEIPAIPFKGPVLASSVYRDLGLRQFGDLDILIRPCDLRRAENLLISQGYRRLNTKQESPLMRSEPVSVFVPDHGDSYVDLHWGLTRTYCPFQLDNDSFWERLNPVSLVGTTVLSPPPEDMLLILSMHGSRHLWSRLEWICDVAELLLVHPGMDWGRVMEQAKALGSERTLFLGLLLGRDVLGAAIPEEVTQKVRADPTIKSLAKQVRGSLFSQVDEPGVVKQFMFCTRMRERWQDKLPTFLYLMRRAVVPNSRDYELVQLSSFLGFLYYLIRLIRLIGKYGLLPLRRLLRV